MRRAMIAAFSAATLVFSGPAAADEIEDSISEALSAYRNNDYSAAKQALDYASQLIAQKNAEGLAAVLPEALSGWTAEDVETQEAAAAMFGGIWAARTYEKGGVAVKVQIMGDSPLLATWMPMMSNSAVAAAMGKMTRIGKRRALQTKEGQVIMVVGNRFLVMIEGSASMEDKTAYAAAIDFDTLETF
jgi:hypothetical protein